MRLNAPKGSSKNRLKYVDSRTLLQNDKNLKIHNFKNSKIKKKTYIQRKTHKNYSSCVILNTASQK